MTEGDAKQSWSRPVLTVLTPLSGAEKTFFSVVETINNSFGPGPS